MRLYTTTPPKEKPDVIVVGSGVAGVCTSIAAAEKGASVLLIDRNHGGGASAMSGGVVYAGGGTKQQKEAGYGFDTPENMMAYLREEVGDAVREKTLKRFCDESVSRLEWLEKHGARFEASMCPYKTSFPTDKHYLYYSGNEKSHPFDTIAKPAPRGHRMVHPGFSGAGLWRALFDSAMRLGVQFLPASKVERVLLDSNGSVSGIEHRTLRHTSPNFRKHKKLCQGALKYQLLLEPLANRMTRRAQGIWQRESKLETTSAPAVVISAGGFAFNPEMRQEHLPEWSNVKALGTPADDGSGIKLGQAAGGSVSHLNRMSAWRFLYPPSALLEGIVVSDGGQRMMAEDVYGAALSETIIRHFGGKAFVILDSALMAKAKKQVWAQMQMPGKAQVIEWLYWSRKKANSLEALARKLGIASDGLSHTVDAYNNAISTGATDPMQKTPDYCSPITQGPFYGIDVSITAEGVHAVPGLTLGGLRVDEDTGLVLNEKDEKIIGLYAAGRSAVGVCSNGYISGLSIADGVFAGKRAGEHAANHR
ncbi:fumarate reductase succinate dehydrogenase flavoprotein domain protein [Ilyonectria robusta]